MGLYVIRGDNVVVIGELDNHVDSQLNVNNIKGEPLIPLIN